MESREINQTRVFVVRVTLLEPKENNVVKPIGQGSNVAPTLHICLNFVQVKEIPSFRWKLCQPDSQNVGALGVSASIQESGAYFCGGRTGRTRSTSAIMFLLIGNSAMFIQVKAKRIHRETQEARFRESIHFGKGERGISFNGSVQHEGLLTIHVHKAWGHELPKNGALCYAPGAPLPHRGYTLREGVSNIFVSPRPSIVFSSLCAPPVKV